MAARCVAHAELGNRWGGGSHIIRNSSLTTITVQVWFGAETRGEGVEGTDKEVETALRKIAKVFSRPLFMIIVIIITLSIRILDYCYWTLILLLEFPCTLADRKYPRPSNNN